VSRWRWMPFGRESSRAVLSRARLAPKRALVYGSVYP
jgi:hypothetical protein